MAETGCRDKTLPKDDKPICIPLPLYFAKCSQKWLGGVAFVGLERDQENIALGRMYLITQEQFSDVFSQENNDSGIAIDFEEVREKGSKILRKSWYGTVIYLNDNDGYPVFTFTAYWNIGDKQFTAPSDKYLNVLISGLKDTYKLADEKIAEYLIGKPGISGNFERDRLVGLAGLVTSFDTGQRASM